MPVHVALAEHERALNADVQHPLMRGLELPYPVLVGRIEAGEWSSSVPDRLRFEGRAPVRVGEDVEVARAGVEAVVADACPEARLSLARRPVRLGADRSARPLRGRRARGGERRADRAVAAAGVPWGADMRLWTARGIPTVMVGTPGIELAHAVDEHVDIGEMRAARPRPEAGARGLLLARAQVRQHGEHAAVVVLAGGEAELAEDVGDVLLDGAGGDDERAGDRRRWCGPRPSARGPRARAA